MKIEMRRAFILVLLLVGTTLTVASCTSVQPASKQGLAVAAIMDPALAPPRGCAALNGEWRNQGYRIEGRKIENAVLSGAVGLAADSPDAAFADRVRIDRRSDGSISIIGLATTFPVAAVTALPEDILCTDTEARLTYPEEVQLSVDQQGSLWVKASGSSRRQSSVFYPVERQLAPCIATDKGYANAPAGMAAVIVDAGDLHAQLQRVDGVDTSLGQIASQHADVVYLLPGTHQFDIRIWPLGDTRKDMPQTALALSGDIEACHLYIPVGGYREGQPGWAGLADLDMQIATDCTKNVNQSGSLIQLSADQQHLIISQRCYSSSDSAGEKPPRQIPLPPLLTSK